MQTYIRYRSRFFVRDGHENTYAPNGNHSYQNYEQSRQKLGTFSEIKVLFYKSKPEIVLSLFSEQL